MSSDETRHAQNLRSESAPPLARALRKRVGGGPEGAERLALRLHVSTRTAEGYLAGRTPTFSMFQRMAETFGRDFVEDAVPAAERHYAIRALLARAA